jgi:hypothetical protein
MTTTGVASYLNSIKRCDHIIFQGNGKVVLAVSDNSTDYDLVQHRRPTLRYATESGSGSEIL